MAICSKCGSLIDDGQKFCPTCGAPIEAAENNAGDKISEFADNLGDKLNDLNNTVDTTAEFDPADIEANKAMGILAYFGILVLIPIFAAKESKYAKFHANQGLVLMLAEIILTVLSGIPILGLIFGLLSLVCVVLAILGIVNACKGLAKELPIIGKFATKMNLIK